MGVWEWRRRSRHGGAVAHVVRDEPPRPGDQVGPLVPLWRSGTRVGPASLAGPEAGLLRGRGTGEEPHVLRLGRYHRAARPAVDPRGQHGREEPAVEPRVL